MINDSRSRYGLVSRIFHWSMAVLIGWQLLKLGDRIDDGEHWVGQVLVPWHISIGATVLVLVVLRLWWTARQSGRRPLPLPGQELPVRAGHALLYASMLLLPITGISYMLGKGYGLNVFGVQLVEKGTETSWLATFGQNHSLLAWFILILIVGHIGISLIHHFIKRDDILRRML